MTGALLITLALIVAFMAGRAWEAHDRLRTLERSQPRWSGEKTGLLP